MEVENEFRATGTVIGLCILTSPHSSNQSAAPLQIYQRTLMRNLCCDCCRPDESQTDFISWSYRKDHSTLYTNPSCTNLTPTQSYVKISSNRNRHQRSKNKSLQLSTFQTITEAPTSDRTRVLSPIVPKSQVDLQQKLKQERMKTLQRENGQYLQIINKELIPLKREYEHLKREYRSKLQLVHQMNLRLEEIERMHCGPSKGL